VADAKNLGEIDTHKILIALCVERKWLKMREAELEKSRSDYFELWRKHVNRLGIDRFESAIVEFGTKNALEYFATPEDQRHLWSDEWEREVLAKEASK